MLARHVLFALGLLLSGFAVAEVPNLQLGIGNGFYDGASETVVTTARQFILHAYAGAGIDSDADYALSISILYDRGLDPQDFGSFYVNGHNISAADMNFGLPPPRMDAAGQDERGLGKFGLSKVWFIEQPFTFDPARRTPVVNTRYFPQHMPLALANMTSDFLYFQSFGVSTLGLKDGYNLYFTLYHADYGVANPGGAAGRFAPLSHDAATAYVMPFVPIPVVPLSEASSIPEPGLLLLFMLALLGIGYSRKRSLQHT